MNPQNGEILAMASRPTFDPNQPYDVAAEAWKNRAIAEIYEPGSTFKPCIVAWALQKGLIKPDEMFDCENGQYRMGGRTLHDHHPYGPLNVIDILAKSSNIGMAKIGERLTNDGLYEATAVFGFGRESGIELPGELPGLVRPLKQWTGYSLGSVPMGQEIAVTPLQVMAAYGTLSNGGRSITPHIVLQSGNDKQSPRSIVVADVIRREISEWITREALTEVVDRGTGKKAKLEGYTVFGKTGTSQKLDPDTGAYSKNKHVSSFICGAPAENPGVLVLVTVDEASVGTDHYGGTVAAPAATEILQKTLTQLRITAQPTAIHFKRTAY
jgi:cell division protein FtsI/penicillin-binding protein 2